MIIYYDSYCKLCTKSSIIWKKFDWFGRVKFISFRTLRNYSKDMEQKLHIYSNNQWYIGYEALIHISKALPIIWPFLPVMYFIKWIGLGDFLYSKIAQSRTIIPVNQCGEHCSIHHENENNFNGMKT